MPTQTHIKPNTYKNYKSSGVEWLCDIPEHWEVKKTPYLFSNIGSGTTPTAGDIKYYDGSINFLQTGDLNDGKILKTKKTLKEKALKDFSSLKVYPKGSLVMAMYGATIGKLGVLDIEATTNQACCVFVRSKTTNIQFFFNVLFAFRKEIISFGYGGGQPNISQDLIKSLRFPIPPLPEQKAIANFLDDKTQKIDQAIAIKVKQINLLKERKQIIIHKLVTGQLVKNGDAWTEPTEVKDSGVEWIGKIPKHWEVIKMSFLTSRIGDGLHGTPVYTDNTGFYFINGNNLSTGNILITEQTKTVSEREYQINKKELTDKTLLISINGTIGNVAFYNGEKVMLGKSAAYLNFKSNVNIEYIKVYLESINFKNYYELELSGSTIKNFSLHSISKTPIVIPNDKEQTQIVAYLDEKTQKIESAISIKQQEIAQLKEYKSSLINSVVTGKVRVC